MNIRTSANYSQQAEARTVTVAFWKERGCAQITPYQAGFEDARYGRQHANPFRFGTSSWRKYEMGSQDAQEGAAQ